MNPLKIVFMGSGDYALPCLQALAKGPHHILCVITQPDRPAGRSQKVKAGVVKALAQELSLRIEQPENINLHLDLLQSLSPDLTVIVSYGQILKQSLIDAPRLGTVNVHASLLPRWRGASPINHAILAGDQESGITIFKLVPALDAGNILWQERLPIDPEENAGSLFDRLAWLGAAGLTHFLEAFIEGKTQEQSQDPSLITYAPLMKKEDGFLDFTLPAQKLQRQILAYDPWPGAHCQALLQGKSQRLVIKKAQAVVATIENGQTGHFLGMQDGKILIGAGQGQLAVESLQVAGKRIMSASDFMNGYTVPKNEAFIVCAEKN